MLPRGSLRGEIRKTAWETRPRRPKIVEILTGEDYHWRGEKSLYHYCAIALFSADLGRVAPCVSCLCGRVSPESVLTTRRFRGKLRYRRLPRGAGSLRLCRNIRCRDPILRSPCRRHRRASGTARRCQFRNRFRRFSGSLLSLEAAEACRPNCPPTWRSKSYSMRLWNRRA